MDEQPGARTEELNIFAKSLLLSSYFFFAMAYAILIPSSVQISLDLASKVGRYWSSIGSGLVIGAYFISGILGMGLFRYLRSLGCSYKGLYTYPFLGRVCVNFVIPAFHNEGTWGVYLVVFVIFARLTEGALHAGQTLCAIEILTLTSVDRVALHAQIALLINTGIGCGMLLAAATETASEAGLLSGFWIAAGAGDMPPATRCSLVMAILWSIFFMLCLIFLSSQDPKLNKEEAPLNEQRSAAQGDDQQSVRKRVIIAGILYSTCRALVGSGIDGATVMILELERGWSRRAAALAVGCCYLTAIGWHLLFGHLRRHLPDSSLVSLCSISCTVSCLAFFDIPVANKTVNAALVLLADSVIFPLFLLSSGIVQAYGTRAAISSSTVFGIQSLLVVTKFFNECVGRGLGPSVSRAALAGGGINTYAAMQLGICVFASSLWHFVVKPNNEVLEDRRFGAPEEKSPL